MRFRPRLWPLKQIAVAARLVVAAALVFALLSGAAPFNASSSVATQLCAMSCCIGKPPHPAGSCGMSFAREGTARGEASACDAMDMSMDMSSEHHDGGGDAATGGTMWMLDAAAPANDEELASPNRHAATAYHSRQQSFSQNESPQSASITAQFLTAPCSPECGACASGFAQEVRPSRDGAALAYADKPRPPTGISLKGRFENLSFCSTERRRRIRPRAPPFS